MLRAQHRSFRKWRAAALSWVTFLLSPACEPEVVPPPYVPTHAHDAYLHSLRESGLDQTALGRDFRLAAESALRSPTDVRAPFEGSFYVDSSRATSAGYRFAVPRGQRTEVQVALLPPGDARLFIDLFREVAGEAYEPQPDAPSADRPHDHVATGDEGSRRLAFEPRRDGVYVLRIQPELLRGGSVRVRIRNVPSLEFPVEGKDTSAIGSRFGAPREGGRRQHHGIDIFAPRHTVVRAASVSRVRLVADWRLGGRVVWLEDLERRLRLYFAHLETQDVEEGMWLRPGDPIGTVGNSGNARTTPPHLHFGVYVRGEGPIDPLPFLEAPKRRAVPITVEPDVLGTYFRTRGNGARLFGAPQADVENEREPEPQRIEASVPVRAIGAYGRRLYVELPDGHRGYVEATSVEPILDRLSTIQVDARKSLLDRPSRASAPIRTMAAGEPVNVLGRFDGFLLVQGSDSDARGWLAPIDGAFDEQKSPADLN